MTFAALLVHPLAIVTPTYDVTDDEYGHPDELTPTVELVSGMVQPRSAREVALSTQAGAEIGDYVIFLLPRRISNAAHIRDSDGTGVLAGGRRFEVLGVRSYEFGSAPHLELDCRLVGSSEGPTVGS